MAKIGKRGINDDGAEVFFKKNEIKNRIEYIAFLAVIKLMKALPYSWSKSIACGLFMYVGYGLGIRKRVARIQIQKVFPHMDDVSISRLLKSVYRNMALGALESYILDDQELIQSTSIIGQEHVDKALSYKKGAILVTGHFGSWEAARILPAKGIPVAVIAKKQRNRLFNDYTDRVRMKQGASIIEMRNALRGVVEHLGNNEFVAILADQNAGKRGFITDFLGFPASHWKGAAKISLKRKVPIIPGFALRNSAETLDIVFEPLIYHPDWDDSDENCLKVIHEINQVLEAYIRKYPEQWFWVHKRWKGAYDMFH